MTPERDGGCKKCPSNSCSELASDEPHRCPYAWETNGDDSECDCCEECEHQCAMNI